VVTAAHWDANTHLDTSNAVVSKEMFDKVQYKLLQDPDVFVGYILNLGGAFVGFRGEYKPGNYSWDAEIARITASPGIWHRGDAAVPYRFMWLPPLSAPVDGDDSDPAMVSGLLCTMASIRETAARMKNLGHEPGYTGPLGHLWPIDDLPCKDAATLVATHDFDEEADDDGGDS